MSAPAPAWRCERLTVWYPRARAAALADITLDIAPARCTAVLGPNGSGKSTLLKALLGVVVPSNGRVECLGRPLLAWSLPALARTVGVVAQEETEAFPMTARALVAMGRYPHLGPWRSEGPADAEAIAAAMQRCDVAAFADRPLDTLSGGERQRVRIARALAQEPRALALDEPTASLDLAHEMEILALLRSFADDGVTVVHITHHLTLAARYADRVVLLQDGRLVAEGPPADVLTPERVEAVFGWPVAVARTEAGASYLVPDGDAR
jgi:iron complex transport system ATP-binding protein